MVKSGWNCECEKCGLEVETLKDGICSTCIMIQELDEAIKVMDDALEDMDEIMRQHHELIHWARGITV